MFDFSIRSGPSRAEWRDDYDDDRKDDGVREGALGGKDHEREGKRREARRNASVKNADAEAWRARAVGEYIGRRGGKLSGGDERWNRSGPRE